MVDLILFHLNSPILKVWDDNSRYKFVFQMVCDRFVSINDKKKTNIARTIQRLNTFHACVSILTFSDILVAQVWTTALKVAIIWIWVRILSTRSQMFQYRLWYFGDDAQSLYIVCDNQFKSNVAHIYAYDTQFSQLAHCPQENLASRNWAFQFQWIQMCPIKPLYKLRTICVVAMYMCNGNCYG